MSITHIGERRRITTKFELPSKTRQEMAHMCDINVIVAKTQGREMVMASMVKPSFGDFSLDLPYDRMLEQLNQANEAFMELPAADRRKYGDDPAAWLAAQEEEIQKAVNEEKAKVAAEKAAKAKAAKIAKAKETLAMEEPKED